MKKYGIAIDIGTTTVTAGLIDTTAKKEIVRIIEPNPQAEFGQDVISRIDYSTKNKNGLQELHNSIIACINRLTEKLLKANNKKKSDIECAVIVGNTAMEHFFLKIPAKKLAEAPYVSALSKKTIFATGGICLLPVIKSFVGSDLTAGILSTGLLDKKNVNLLVDIGTNGEIALSVKGRLFVVSTAAGPAFEISGKGLLGSDIIEIVSKMLKNGIIDKSGRVKNISAKITQKDIRRIQVAKAAIMAGVLVLMKKAGITLDNINNLYVAGKFGALLDKEAAINIGLLPDISLDRIKLVGNAAYNGAVLALCSKGLIKQAEAITEKAIHISLFGRKDFQEEFVKNMGF